MITSFIASLLGLMFVFLSVRTLLTRRKFKVAVGDSGNVELLRAMRAHGNFAEYVPLALILIYFVEQAKASSFLISILGTGLLLGRISHAYGISKVNENFFFRVFGMSCTLTVIGASCLYLLFRQLF